MTYTEAQRCTYILPYSMTGLPDARCIKAEGHDEDHLFNVPVITTTTPSDPIR